MADEKPPYLQYALLAVGVGAVAYFVLRPSTAQAMPLPATTAPLPATTVTPTAAPSFPTAQQHAPAATDSVTPSGKAALIARLRSNEQARRVYYFQAMMYSGKVTDILPDGIAGPVTAGFVADVNRLAGFPNAPTAVTDAVLARIPAALVVSMGHSGGFRVVPQQIPADVIALVNATARRANVQADLLQTLPITM